MNYSLTCQLSIGFGQSLILRQSIAQPCIARNRGIIRAETIETSRNFQMAQNRYFRQIRFTFITSVTFYTSVSFDADYFLVENKSVTCYGFGYKRRVTTSFQKVLPYLGANQIYLGGILISPDHVVQVLGKIIYWFRVIIISGLRNLDLSSISIDYELQRCNDVIASGT